MIDAMKNVMITDHLRPNVISEWIVSNYTYCVSKHSVKVFVNSDPVSNNLKTTKCCTVLMSK